MANIKEFALIGVIIFVLGIGYFIMSSVLTTTVDQIVTTPSINESVNGTQAVQGFNAYTAITNRMDYVIFSVFMAMCLGLIIMGWFANTHPLFAVFYFIVIVIMVVISTFLANVWEDVTQNTHDWGVTLSTFPKTNNILLNLPIYLSVVSVLGLVAMFGKPVLQGGGGMKKYYLFLMLLFVPLAQDSPPR